MWCLYCCSRISRHERLKCDWISEVFSFDLTRFIELAGEINTAMPQRVVEKIAEALSQRAERALQKARILVIGVGYKKNVDDTRESPALEIMDLLEKRGALVPFHAPPLTEIPPTRRA